MYELDGVSVAYARRPILDDVCAAIGPSPVAIMGPSGSGKSTLLRILAGHQRVDSGSVTLNGTRLREPSWAQSGDHRVALLYQDYRLIDFLSISENVMLASECRGIAMAKAEAESILESVGLDYLDPSSVPGTISGGEQQRVAIARAIASRANVLLADEPTGALDAAATDVIAQLFLRIGREAGVQIIVATHDHVVAGQMGGILRIESGRLLPE